MKRNYNTFSKDFEKLDNNNNNNMFSSFYENSEEKKRSKKKPKTNLRQLIISIAKLASSGNVINKNFQEKERELDEYKNMKHEDFYMECYKLLLNENPYIGIFCATQIEHYKTPSPQFVKIILQCYKNIKTPIIQRLLLNFFKNVKMSNFFDFLLKNLLKDICYIKVLNQIIKNVKDIPLNRFNMFMKLNYPHAELFFKTFKTIIKKTKIPQNILNKQYLGILLSYIHKKKIFGKQTKRGLISLFQTYGKVIHQNFKNKILQLLFLSIQNKPPQVIDYYLLYEIIKTFKLKPNISYNVIKMFIIPALKLQMIYKEPSVILLKELYIEKELKDNNIKQFSRMILPYLSKSADFKKLMMQYNEKNPIDKNNGSISFFWRIYL